MLSIALFGAIFTSVLWLIYAFKFISTSLSGISFFDAGLTNVLLYVLFICLPVFMLWAIFGFINQYFNNRFTGRQLHKLFAQMKKNQEYSDLLARIMLETEQNIKNSFILSRFDLLIADMNELLSEFILRERLASLEQIEHLWSKVQNGGKWSFGKVLIENYNQQPSFQKRIYDDAVSDNILSGTILEFCARYQTLVSLLEKHDREKIFLNIVETGVFGKVFAIFAPVSDEIRRSKEIRLSLEDNKKTFSDTSSVTSSFQQTDFETDMPVVKRESLSKNIFNKFIPSKKEYVAEKEEKDAFSLALERSFGNENVESKTEPIFERSSFSTEENSVTEENILEAQKTLDGLKKEWHDIEKTSSPIETEEDLVYPFSGWTDAGNYKK